MKVNKDDEINALQTLVYAFGKVVQSNDLEELFSKEMEAACQYVRTHRSEFTYLERREKGDVRRGLHCIF